MTPAIIPITQQVKGNYSITDAGKGIKSGLLAYKADSLDMALSCLNQQRFAG